MIKKFVIHIIARGEPSITRTYYGENEDGAHTEANCITAEEGLLCDEVEIEELP